MKTLRLLGALVAAQLALVGVYYGVESLRTEAVPFAVETLDEAAPALSTTRADVAVAPPDGAHLVHFWATWCGPCQTELPGLLAASEQTGVPLLAVTDEPWPTVERWFDGTVPSAIVRDATGQATGAWQVSGLPDTFVVRDGRVVARMGGPRDWSSPAARDWLRALEVSP